jgi:opacity protein-like surface antigen
MLSLNTGKTRAVNLNLVIGPQLGISVGSRYKTIRGTNDPNAILSVKKGDLGFAYGAGLDFGINAARTVRVGLGYRGVYGLFDISDDNRTTAGDNYLVIDKTNVKTNAAYVGISFLF